MVNIIMGLRLVLYIVGIKGWLSLYLLIMMAPLVRRYIKILTGLMGGININESFKKFIVLLVVIVIGGVMLEWGYVLSFIMFTNGVLGTVLMGVYVFVLLGARLWVTLLSYTLLGNYVSDNYKVLGLGVLPLIMFFVKMCGSFLLMWIVIVYAIFNVL